MQPEPQDWERFYGAMKRKSGLDLYQYKAGQLQRRIVSMMQARGHKSLDEFWRWIESSPEGLDWFQDKLAINVSELFRNPEKWVQMQETILPDLLTRSRTLKCWSAGCSYGAEAHTLAAILREKFPGSHTILGTDIDQAALSQAGRSEFNANDVRHVPKEYQKYFQKSGSAWHAVPEIRRSLKFRKGNLLEPPAEGGFDLIMCRNVVIYFTEEAKDQLYQRFFDAMKPGGVLFVGSTERIHNSAKIGYQQTLSFFYQKPITKGEQQWRHAS